MRTSLAIIGAVVLAAGLCNLPGSSARPMSSAKSKFMPWFTVSVICPSGNSIPQLTSRRDSTRKF